MSTPSNSDIEVLPNLPSLDLVETRAFYQDVLGFDQIIYEDTSTLILRRDNWEIHFWHCSNKEICENSSLYVRGGGIDTLYEEFSSKNLATDGKSQPKLSSFQIRPWNMKEFYIHDPHGNLLKFGRVPDSADTE
ncbi:bleomycin resistance protein [Pseudovibrio exalbescens]|uniref:bleomycin resistance protein n=1 Tax=Pseudovibrio exalbescens TaxID=197461 RepID=UPI000C99B0B4|nr:VOC family protein [Pseudovibrio exalbescens]